MKTKALNTQEIARCKSSITETNEFIFNRRHGFLTNGIITRE